MSSSTSPLPLPSLDQLIDRVKQDPRAISTVPTEAEKVRIFEALFNEEGVPATPDRAVFLLFRVANSGSPECFKRLIIWAVEQRLVSTLSIAISQQLRQAGIGQKIKNLLLKPECAEAIKLLNPPAKRKPAH